MKLYTIVYSDTKDLIPSYYKFEAKGWDDKLFEPLYLFFKTREKAQEVLDQWLKYDKHNVGVDDDVYEIVEKEVT